MDKSWLYIDRVKPEFAKGLTAFKEYARQFLNREGTVRCPCANCRNTTCQTLDAMFDHCYAWGWSKGYNIWLMHGETPATSHKRARRSEIVVESGDETRPVINDFMGEGPEEEILQPEDDHKYEELVSALHEKVYPGCENSSLLKFLDDLMHIKVLYNWPDESFDVLLKKLKEVLPKGSTLPDSFYTANSLMNKLGIGYGKIDTCLNSNNRRRRHQKGTSGPNPIHCRRFEGIEDNGRAIGNNVVERDPIDLWAEVRRHADGTWVDPGAEADHRRLEHFRTKIAPGERRRLTQQEEDLIFTSALGERRDYSIGRGPRMAKSCASQSSEPSLSTATSFYRDVEMEKLKKEIAQLQKNQMKRMAALDLFFKQYNQLNNTNFCIDMSDDDAGDDDDDPQNNNENGSQA